MKLKIFFFFIINILKSIEEECSNWDNKYKCRSNGNFRISNSWDERGFQTPPRNDIYNRYKSTYQDMHYFVGYAQLKYSSNKKNCTISFISRVNPILGEEGKDYYILYTFGEIEQESNIINLNSDNDKYPNGMPISARIIDKRTTAELVKLELEEEYFLWDNPKINSLPAYENGQKGGIVELFGWPYEDIILECEFLSHAGYMGIKIYSPNEHLFNYGNIEDEMLNPWWYINQPVSYKLHSRMGDRKQLKKLINTCRSYNLRIYADIIINHMTGYGYDMYDDHRSGDDYGNCFHWNEKGSSGGSPFWTTGFRYENNPYTGLEPGMEYPSVPYFPSDFHCKYDISNWDDPEELNGGSISGLADLNTDKENVQQRIVDYFVELLSIGFSGFSIPNSKHIYPSTFAILFNKLKESLGGIFPEDFIAILQINYGWEKNILMCEDAKRSSFGNNFLNELINIELTEEDIEKIKIWNSGYPQETPECDGVWEINPERYAVSIEQPDDINLNSYYNIYIRDKDIDAHRQRTMDMFRNTFQNIKIKSVFSMFSLINDSKGFPDGKSDCKKCQTEVCRTYCTKSFPYKKAYDPLSIGYDTGNSEEWKEGEYTRVHRDLEIINSMREWLNLESMTEEELYAGERLKANCSEECLICNEESKMEKMCLICNKSNGFYPLIYPGYEQKYFKCLNSSITFERLYFNEAEEAFMPCYESCRECDRGGNPENHNCLKCDVDLVERPGTTTNLKNCVVDCSYNYSLTPFGQYKCIEIVKCGNTSYYIKEKNLCVDECKNDDTYKYSYHRICLKICPNNTFNINYTCLDKIEIIETEIITNYLENDLATSDLNNFSFIDIDENDECAITEEEIQYISFKEDGKSGINNYIKDYKKQFYYTDKHILQLKNMKYNVIIYRNSSCIDELYLEIPKIDFGQCYDKVREEENITDSLIVVYVEKSDVYNPNSSYSLYDPISAEKINGESICEDDLIVIEKNITHLINKLQKKRENIEIIKGLMDQGIDIFNKSSDFYQDICFHFESPIKKDMTLRDRILSIDPNITLCDPSCEFKGVNLTTKTCICLCRFNDIINNDYVKENFIIEDNINEIITIVSNSNIEVLACFKNAFKYIKNSIGGFIMLVSIVICIIFTIIFYIRDLNIMIMYIVNLTDKYLNFISKKSSLNEMNNSENRIKIKNIVIDMKNNEENLEKKGIIKNNPILILDKKEKVNIIKDNQEKKNILNKMEIYSKDAMINSINMMNELNIKSDANEKNKEFFAEFLAPSIEDLDFEDAMRKDHRSFFGYLCDSIINRQIIVNTFYSSEPLRPISLKIILFDVDLVLYFIINGLFYSEAYISTIFHNENEKFFSFIPRSINRFVYTTIVSIVISFLIDFFFVEEKKIKGIFIREKDNLVDLKLEITLLIKIIKKRCLAFIITIFVLSIFFWYYLICFNYVYPYTQYDWIKSSIVIILFMQVLSLIASLAETLFRFLSFFFRSEKLFKLSKLFD